MSTVQVFSTELSILSIPPELYTFFFHGITKLILHSWEDDYLPPSSASSGIFRSHCIPPHNSPIAPPSSLDLSVTSGDKTPLVKASSSSSTPSSSSTNKSSLPHQQLYPTSSRVDDFNSNHTDRDQEIEFQQALRDHIESLREFINISFTPVECSVICPTELVNLLFGPAFATHKASILKEHYLAIQVEITGSNSGANLIEITAPLSNAGIPIFFIPTYFSNYVIVPFSAKNKVTRTLEARGFVFSNEANSYVNVNPSDTPSPLSPTAQDSTYYNNPLESSISSLRSISSAGSTESRPPLLEGAPLSPYLASIGAQTVETFRRNSVKPVINFGTKLLLTGVRSRSRGGPQGIPGLQQDSIFLSIVNILIHPPDFFSVTIINGTEVSFIINEETAQLFSTEDLLGSMTDFVIPISFDFSSLPEDSTGIVAGVASQLYSYDPDKPFPQAFGVRGNNTSNPAQQPFSPSSRNSTSSMGSSIGSLISERELIQISYLSTAKTGVVMVSEVDMAVASAALSVFMHKTSKNGANRASLSNPISTDEAVYYHEDNLGKEQDKQFNNDSEDENSSDSEEDYGDSNTSRPAGPSASLSSLESSSSFSITRLRTELQDESLNARPQNQHTNRDHYQGDYYYGYNNHPSYQNNNYHHNHRHHHHHHHSPATTATSSPRSRSKLSNNIDFDD